MNMHLLLATSVICVGILVSVSFPRWPIPARALWRVATLVLLTVAMRHAIGSPLSPILSDSGWERLWQQSVIVGWWLVAARCLAGIARLSMSVQKRAREAQILSDLIGASIYGATALAVVDIVFAVPIGGLIATSGIIAVVMGLALQNTLSDVFSGIAIDIERPYRVGDSLWIEGGIEGYVTEVNWRSTLVATANGDVAIVPNSIAAKSRLINHSLPALVRRSTIEVRLDPRIMPERCRAALDAAVSACLLPLHAPAATVNLTALRGDGAAYEISFYVPSSKDLGAARSELLAQVQRHLFHAAIPMAVAGISEIAPLAVPNAADLLARSAAFDGLAAQDIDLLAAEMREATFEVGAALFARGEEADAMHVVSAGVVGVRFQMPDGSEAVRRVGPGGSLGMLALMSGTPHAATASALTDVKAFRLADAGFARAIEVSPELRTGLERMAVRSRAAIMRDAAAADGPSSVDGTADLASRMRAFLHRLARERTVGAARVG